MTATALLTDRSALDALVAHADRQLARRRPEEGERTLHEAITIAPDRSVGYRRLIVLLLDQGRDLEALGVCGAMLARVPARDVESLHLATELLLTLHIRHEPLLSRRSEPWRIDPSRMEIPDAAPMALAPGFLSRARAVARATIQLVPGDASAHLALAECELRSGHGVAARRAAERAASLADSTDAFVTLALASFIDDRQRIAIDALLDPRFTELAPALGVGRLIAVRVDPALNPASVASDPNRTEFRVPCTVRRDGSVHEHWITARTAEPVVRRIRNGRIVGGHFFPLDPVDRGWIHGIVGEPARELAVPRGQDIPEVVARGRNCILAGSSERHLLLHTPAIEREESGRAMLLASSRSASYNDWIIEGLGRLTAVPDLIGDPEMRFIVPSPPAGFQTETLAWLGILSDRTITVAPDELVAFDEIVAVQHRFDGDCPAPGVLRWLRDHLTIPVLGQQEPARRRLFVRPAVGRGPGLANVEPLERICAGYGFDAVDPSTMTVAAQRDLFGEAAVIVMPDGAALANLLFVPSGGHAIFLGRRASLEPRGNAIAEALGHSSCWVAGEERPTAAVYPDWFYHIDPDELRGALESALA